MEEETEILDWGNEDDEQQQMSSEAFRNANRTGSGGFDSRRVGDAEDAEDAVSLGGDEDDMQDDYASEAFHRQDSNSKGEPTTPKSASFSQQHNSTYDRDLQRENSNASQKPARFQGSPQNSPRRSQSFGKLTHALPPKPAVASVPFMHPSHPSIIEATAMGKFRHDREKKSNGSVGKPTSSGDGGDTLPPDWEARHASSGHGVYYYNVRTHESTWMCPSNSVKSSSRDRDKPLGGKTNSDNDTPARLSEQQGIAHPSRPEVITEPPNSGLSYQDRHYRPAGAPQKDISKRDERPNPQLSLSRQLSSSPPHTPIIYEREQSPIPRGRGRDRPPNSHRKTPPGDHRNRSNPVREDSRADSQPFQDRRWIPSHEGFSQPLSTKRSTSFGDYHRRTDTFTSIPASPTREDSRNYQNDVVPSSASRRRSPPPKRPLQPSYELQTVPVLPPGSTPAPRQKSRFDRPPKPSQTTQQDDIYVPDELLLPQRDPGPEVISAQTSEQLGPQQRPADESGPIHHSRTVESTSYSEPLERSVSASSASPATHSQSDQSRLRKRQPLPPQSDRFREMSKQPPSAERTPSNTAITTPQGPRDGTAMMPQRPLNIDTNIPSGPRFQPQPTHLRDASHPDFAHSLRAPPSGPSATATSKSLRRPSFDPSFPPNESSGSRERDSMDVDIFPQSRNSASQDPSFRANSGMYADREPRGETSSDVLPRGPRAMASKPGQPPLPPATSPATPLFIPRNITNQDHRTRDRSPLAHDLDHDWEPRHSPVDKLASSARPPPRNDPFWMADNPRDRFRGESGGVTRPQAPPYYEADEKHQDRRATPSNQHRPSHFSQAPPPLHLLSSTNAVPIGNRNRAGAPLVGPPPYSPDIRYRQQLGDNSELGRRPVHSNVPMKDSYGRSTEFREGASAHQHSAPHHPHTQRPESAFADPLRYRNTSFERGLFSNNAFQTSAAIPRPRRDTYRGSAELGSSRFDPHVQRTPAGDSEPRIWTPREPPLKDRERELSPQSRLSWPHTNQYPTQIPTPPPPSTEPSPLQEASTYIAPKSAGPPDRFSDDDRGSNRYNSGPRSLHSEDSPLRRRREQYIPPKSRPDIFEAPQRRNSISLEGRLSERYDERYIENPYRPSTASVHHDRDREIYPEQPPPRQMPPRGRSNSFHGEARSWDRSEPERQFPPPAPQQDPSYRSSKPIRIRRPPSTSVPTRTEESNRLAPESDEPVGSMWGPERGHVEGEPYRQHDTTRRPGSLLDRLSFDAGNSPSDMSPSLRDRVMLPTKRDREDMMDHGSGPMEYYDGEDDGGVDSSGKRVKRRMGKPKPKRGKRVGGQP